MAKFSFAYESLIKFRESKLLLAKKEMFFVEGQIADLQSKIQKSHADRGELIEQNTTLKRSAGEIQLAADLIHSESMRLGILNDKILALEAELARHKNWVAHLGRELKIVEKLKEKRKEAFENEEKKRELKSADEWVAQKWARIQNGQEREENTI